jgi:transposase
MGSHRRAAGGGKKDPRELKDHAWGRSRGGFSTKMHLLCDGKGHPLHAEVTAGQAHEATAFTTVIENARITDDEGERDRSPVPWGGDKALDADSICAWLDERDSTPVLPQRGKTAEAEPPHLDRAMYRRRNVLARLAGWLKGCRR